MKVSLNWLKKYVPLDDVSAEELERVLPMIGHEVESVERRELTVKENLVVGEVLSREQHPNADRLGVCQVKVAPDAEPLQIVCGASNYKVGDRVPVAVVGCVLPGDFKIKKSKLRGIESNGMMCSAKELGLGDDHEGLMILDDRPEVGTPMSDLVGEGDTVFELELTANRGDCLSHIGVARELAAYFGKSLCLPEVKPLDGAPGEALLGAVEVQTDACPYYTAWSIRGVKVGPSPKWLQEALKGLGLRPINNIVDVTNYVLFETGQPLHAFDANKIRGDKLVVRQATENEKITTLDEKARTLSERMMVIADAERPLVIAGVMGAVDAEVDDSTTDVVLESAWFNPGSVRWTTRRLNLFSDSSHRFTRDVDPAGVDTWGRRAVDLILEVAGGTLSGPCLRHGKPPRGARTIKITGDYVRERIGFEVEDAAISTIFTNLGFSIEGETEWAVTVPSFRPEVDRPIDLVEEFIRLHGTDKIPEVPVSATGLHRHDAPLAQFNRRAVDYLTGQDFVECSHYSLTDGATMARWDSPASAEGLKLANPLNSEMGHMRSSLVPGLLAAMRLNQSHGNPTPRLCETGRVFRIHEGRIYELPAVALILAADAQSRQWRERPQPDFFTAKQLIGTVAALAGIDASAIQYENKAPSAQLQPGHTASAGDFITEGWSLQLGLVNIDLLRECDINGFMIAAEFVFTPEFINQQQKDAVRYTPFSDMPASGKDLALLVDEASPAEDVRRALHAAASDVADGQFAVEDVALFDLYEDEKLAAQGKKSLAFALTFRAPDLTLKDKEVNQAFDAIQARMRDEGYEVR